MKLSLKSLPEVLKFSLTKVAKFRVPAFILVIVAVYGFVLFNIKTLSDTKPSSQSVSGELQTVKTPRLDESVVKQLEKLRDNSVSVRTLFEQARSNPFNE